MPGAFARLGPALAELFHDAGGAPIAFAPFRPSGLLAEQILAGGRPTCTCRPTCTGCGGSSASRACKPGRRSRATDCALLPDRRFSWTAWLSCSRPGLRVVAPQAATDPCGRYVEQCWKVAGMLPAMRAKQASGELLRSVGSGDLPAFLLDGRVAAGMLYLSEARQLDEAQIRTVELPAEQDLHARIRFVVAALTPRGRRWRGGCWERRRRRGWRQPAL